MQPNLNSDFPRELLDLLRCSRDAGTLRLDQAVLGASGEVSQGRLLCETCAAEFRILDGIARLMPQSMTAEDQHEMDLRDQDYGAQPADFVAPAFGWRSAVSDRLEVPDHLRELEPMANRRVLELACGDGRFTIMIAQMGASVLAVDFSLQALRLMGGRLPNGAKIGRVQADINHFHVANRTFDRAFSTTPLDAREQRMTMYRIIADALREDGKFVGSLENDDLTRRWLGLPLARRYSADGIFIEHFSPDRVRREIAPYFDRIQIRPIRVKLPLISSLPPTFAVALARLLARLPGLKNLGEILLFRAEQPVRLPAEGEHRQGSSLVKAGFAAYKHWRKRDLVYDNQVVQYEKPAAGGAALVSAAEKTRNV